MILEELEMKYAIRPVLAVFAAALGMAACDSPTDGEAGARVISVAVDSAAGPLIRTADVTLDAPADIELVYHADNAPTLSLRSAAPASEHTLVLPRLRAAREYTLHVRALPSPDSATELRFGTGPLPAAVAQLTFAESGTPTHPVALVEIVASQTGFTGLVIVEDGAVVWYRSTTGSLFGTARRQNGELVLLDPALGLVSYRLDGSIAHRLPQPDSAPGAAYGRIHHEVIASPQNTLLFIANETRAVAGQNVVGEAIWEWTPESGSVQQRWSAFDHLDWLTERGPRSDATNWLHGNGLAYGPRNNVLISLRNLDQVVSIAPGFASVEWRLGGAGATLALPDSLRFHGQHSATAPQDDRVLVFDNGFNRPGGTYTRVIEYRVDRAGGTASRTWQYRASPDIYAPLVGSARRLENGNTVMLFGMVGDGIATGPITAVEVAADGSERWRLSAGPRVTRVYRLTPLASLAGEQVIRRND
jgi:hypothetical protein